MSKRGLHAILWFYQYWLLLAGDFSGVLGYLMVVSDRILAAGTNVVL